MLDRDLFPVWRFGPTECLGLTPLVLSLKLPGPKRWRCIGRTSGTWPTLKGGNESQRVKWSFMFPASHSRYTDSYNFMTSLYQWANFTGSTLQALRPNAKERRCRGRFRFRSKHKGKIVKDKIEVEETETARKKNKNKKVSSVVSCQRLVILLQQLFAFSRYRVAKSSAMPLNSVATAF